MIGKLRNHFNLLKEKKILNKVLQRLNSFYKGIKVIQLLGLIIGNKYRQVTNHGLILY
jgi:hypothetical protein